MGGHFDSLPDVTAAEELMRRFNLDSEAKAKLRDVVEKRVDDLDEVLEHVERILEMSSSASGANAKKAPSETMLKIARTLPEGGRCEQLEKKLMSGYAGASGRGGARSRSRGR